MKYACVGVIAVCNAVFRLMILCCVAEIFTVTFAESSKFRCFWQPIFLERVDKGLQIFDQMSCIWVTIVHVLKFGGN